MKGAPIIDRFFPTSARPRPPPEFAGLVAGSFVAAFIGVLILISILLILIRVAASIYHLIWKAVWGVSPIASASTSNGGSLSVEQKKEIDDLRSAAIRRHLDKFTMTLKENGIPTQSAIIQQSTNCSLHTNENSLEEEKQEIDIDDVESAIDKVEEADREQQCTRLSSPLLVDDGNDSSSTTNALECTKSQETNHDKLQCLNVNDDTLDCAICHEEYKALERICRSSNSKCTHVFHEECIVHWLVSSGWMNVKERNVLPGNLMQDEKNLLNYDLSCPCCRRPFVEKTLHVEGGRCEYIHIV
mmetsp:Transcript_10632/g.23480  ORF Transcript_10632/g.23480 Transcript_10632/m.23480 type:complete len:301 (+) Transcript_10632:270-1172(+)